MTPVSVPAPTGPVGGSDRAPLRRARPDSAADTPAFRAALVLAAGPEHRFNVDRIAGACRLPRAWVAACVRRLIDNGVWTGGRAACAWRDAGDPRFWNDAAVAEGRLQRRTLPDGGFEWAPAGRWTKAYDFIGPQGDPGGAVLYLDAHADPERLVPAAPPDPEPSAAAEAQPRPFPRPPQRAWSAPELFPGAAWLG